MNDRDQSPMTSLRISARAVSTALDLQAASATAMRLRLTPGTAHLLGLAPCPMLLVLVAAVTPVLVNVWLERKISPPFSSASVRNICRRPWGAAAAHRPDGLQACSGRKTHRRRPMALLFTLGPDPGACIPVILSWLVESPSGQNMLISDVGIRAVFLLESPSAASSRRLLMKWALRPA